MSDYTDERFNEHVERDNDFRQAQDSERQQWEEEDNLQRARDLAAEGWDVVA